MDQDAAAAALLAGLRAFGDRVAGPYALGKQFTFIDIALFPFIQRLIVAERIRGFALPGDDESIKKLTAWKAAVLERPSVARTLPDNERLVQAYEVYVKARTGSV